MWHTAEQLGEKQSLTPEGFLSTVISPSRVPERGSTIGMVTVTGFVRLEGGG